jgi:hypothetical protein
VLNTGAGKVRLGVVILALVAVLTTFLLASGESLDAGGVLAVPLAIWWTSPLVIYFVFCRTRLGSLLIGAAFILIVAALLTALYTDQSSMAAIGLFTIPVLLWLGMAVAVTVEFALSRASTTFTGASAAWQGTDRPWPLPTRSDADKPGA